MTQNYEVYGGDDLPWELREDEVRAPAPPTGPWQVIVEFASSAQERPATVVVIEGDEYGDREPALAFAERTAFDYNPPDPFSPQGRSVYRDGPDGFLVIIEGAMTTWHMSVRIVQYVGGA